MSDSDTTTESNCGGATTESKSESESKCGGAKTEAESDTTSKCGASSSKSDGGSSSKCGGSSGESKKEQTAEKVEATIEDFDGEPGQLVAVGLGPGRASEMTTLAKDTLREADHIVGYTTYIELLPDDVVEGAEDIYSTPMCGEVSRTEEAVDRTLAGNDVAIVGSGDPNVYALAGLALEILESKGATASMVDFDVVAGVPAAQSCAARLGAPLVNDTVTISLSDHLTSMPTIESRLHAAAKEGFTIAIYNPWSRKRRSNYEKCCEILLEHRAPDTPVGVVHGAGRDDEEVEIVELGDLPDLGETDLVDMTTTLLVGNEETYVWDDRMVTPRGYEQKYEY
ncbi:MULTISPECIES: precorrin-3B C(17)-methyltransferase [Haloferax]|uniref:Cobalt-precorrin-3B C(17)-methyltransferase n=1 Tax=Haloferax massiliensis TaxID=1476858 RepID=A0A0D6JUR2_9EURY|nr:MULTISPECIES: precorrin-3B C(17)-methyltransferase [Haloferax]MDS0241566.1 precorrin-3B C(17)-methyltransferase [Haloferax sp. S2CR25]MDS0444687.1 precorrin-3B C(17)-methyltransferase [Haloferax sp. S2CR25-2]CQR51845.1 Cobalt-precorrin-3B C(17)-methyltransferase [Haloferax massiliensis]